MHVQFATDRIERDVSAMVVGVGCLPSAIGAGDHRMDGLLDALVAGCLRTGGENGTSNATDWSAAAGEENGTFGYNLNTRRSQNLVYDPARCRL